MGHVRVLRAHTHSLGAYDLGWGGSLCTLVLGKLVPHFGWCPYRTLSASFTVLPTPSVPTMKHIKNFKVSGKIYCNHYSSGLLWKLQGRPGEQFILWTQRPGNPSIALCTALGRDPAGPRSFSLDLEASGAQPQGCWLRA